jgi:hypothetical protein
MSPHDDSSHVAARRHLVKNPRREKDCVDKKRSAMRPNYRDETRNQNSVEAETGDLRISDE